MATIQQADRIIDLIKQLFTGFQTLITNSIALLTETQQINADTTTLVTNSNAILADTNQLVTDTTQLINAVNLTNQKLDLQNWDTVVGNSLTYTYFSGVTPNNPSGNTANLESTQYYEGVSLIITQTFVYDATDRLIQTVVS